MNMCWPPRSCITARAAKTMSRRRRLIEKAIELDPKYAHAHAWRGCIVGQAWIYNWCADRDAAKQIVISELNIAQSLDDNDSDVHRILAAINHQPATITTAR